MFGAGPPCFPRPGGPLVYMYTQRAPVIGALPSGKRRMQFSIGGWGYGIHVGVWDGVWLWKQRVTPPYTKNSCSSTPRPRPARPAATAHYCSGGHEQLPLSGSAGPVSCSQYIVFTASHMMEDTTMYIAFPGVVICLT